MWTVRYNKQQYKINLKINYFIYEYIFVNKRKDYSTMKEYQNQENGGGKRNSEGNKRKRK